MSIKFNYKRSFYNKNENLFIFGCGGHASSIARVALDLGYNLKGFVDHSTVSTSLKFDVPVISLSSFLKSSKKAAAVIGIGENKTRESVYTELKSQGFDNFPTLVHPSCTLPCTTLLGKGTVLFPNVTIGSGVTIGEFGIINTGVIIDHDAVVHDFVSISPGAILSGNVTLCTNTFIGTGVNIVNDVAVGKNSVIGAGSTVLQNIRANVVAVGSPCREIRPIHS